MSKMIKCKACSEEIASKAKSCPSCGSKNKKPFYKKAWFWIFALLVILGMGGDGSNESTVDSEEETTTIEQPVVSEEETAAVEQPTVQEETVDPTMSHEEFKAYVKNILSESYPSGPVKVEESTSDNLTVCSFSVYPFDGFMQAATLAKTSGNTEEYDKAIDSMKVLSKTISDAADSAGLSNEYAYSLGIQNDLNTDNIVILFLDGIEVMNSFNE